MAKKKKVSSNLISQANPNPDLGANAFQVDLLGRHGFLLHRGEEHQVCCEETDASQVRSHSQPVCTLHGTKAQEVSTRSLYS